jgi:hypothetical protein
MSGTALVLLAIVAILVVVMRALTSRKKGDTVDADDLLPEGEDTELREKFHNSLAAGSETRRVARVYSQVDLSLLKSLLDSRHIPNDLLFANANNLRTGVGIPGWNDSVIVVREADYPAAREVAEDYVASLRVGAAGVQDKPRLGTVVRNLAEAAVAMNPVNPGSRLPEIL